MDIPLCLEVYGYMITFINIFMEMREPLIKINLFSGANVIKLFTAVIYCHSMVISSFCVIKLITLVITMEW